MTGTDHQGGLLVRGRGGAHNLPADYVRRHVELAYATTVHGAQGETVDQAHLLVGEATGAAAAYVGMTRGRQVVAIGTKLGVPEEVIRQAFANTA